MNNLDFFNISIHNNKFNSDFSDPTGVVVIPNSKEDTNDLVEANHALRDLITTYKTLKERFPQSSDLDSIIKEIMRLIETTKNINYTAFCVYFLVLRYSYDAYKKAKNLTTEEKIDLIRKTVELFLENRHEMYLSHGYSDQVLQVMADASAPRRKGATGTKKLSAIMQLFDISRAGTLDVFKSTEKVYILPDKGDSKLLKEIIDFYKIDFSFRKHRDNKNPDIVFKIGSEIYILEHKLTNGGGGSQNMEINEIISFIGCRESNSKVHYISCLQGDYLNKLNKKNKEPKPRTQYRNIIKNLKGNKRNYFVNEFGLIELLRAETEALDKKQ